MFVAQRHEVYDPQVRFPSSRDVAGNGIASGRMGLKLRGGDDSLRIPGDFRV